MATVRYLVPDICFPQEKNTVHTLTFLWRVQEKYLQHVFIYSYLTVLWMCNLKRIEQLQTIFALHKDKYFLFFSTDKHSSTIALKNIALPLADSATKSGHSFFYWFYCCTSK